MLWVLSEALLMSTHNIHFLGKIRQIMLELLFLNNQFWPTYLKFIFQEQGGILYTLGREYNTAGGPGL